MSEKVCFVICPIGEPESDIRKRSDKILKHVITPAVESCGYKAVRADKISEPGMITSQIIEHMVEAALVIADLTDHNPNVFYELAFRHGLKKPFIQIIQKGQKVPFDVRGLRTIDIDLTDPDSVLDARTEIDKQIKSLEKNPSKIETPFSVSLDLKRLRQSDDPEQRSMAIVLSMLIEIKNLISSQKDAEAKRTIDELRQKLDFERYQQYKILEEARAKQASSLISWKEREEWIEYINKISDKVKDNPDFQKTLEGFKMYLTRLRLLEKIWLE